MLTYDTPALRQTGSRNLTGTYMKLVTKYQISAINICWGKCNEKWAYICTCTCICSMWIKINKVGKQEVGIWWVQKRFPLYGVPIWSLYMHIFLSNYWWHKSDIWSQASYTCRYPISWEAFLDPSDSYFLF
jgi:hypothetical protein